MNVIGRSIAVSFLILLPAAGRAQYVENTADPASVALRGPGAIYTLLITGHTADGRLIDRTREAHFRSLDPKTAVVTPAGVVLAVGDGQTTVVAEIDDGRGGATPPLQVAVSVVDATAPRRFNFDNDVEPVLSRPAATRPAATARRRGKTDSNYRFSASTPPPTTPPWSKRGGAAASSRPRRNTASSCARCRAASPTAAASASRPGPPITRRCATGSRPAPPSADRPTPRRRPWVGVQPAERVLAPGKQAAVRIIAGYSDGHEADVTSLAKFLSNNDGLASVDADGLVTAGDAPGEAAVMAGFMNQVDVFRVVVPRAEHVDHYPSVPENTFIDGLVFAEYLPS